MPDPKTCISCPEILDEKYGKGQDQCADCQTEENKIVRLVKDATRFEVIDHRKHSSNIGRAFVSRDCKIELVFQDNGKTLKVFVNDA